MFRGDYKLVKNLPPTGHGEWRLYDIVRDPGETRDLAAAMPVLRRTMQADFARFAARDGVLPMPAGYTAEAQINANGFNKIIRPKLVRAIPWVLALLALATGAMLWRRRRRRRIPVKATHRGNATSCISLRATSPKNESGSWL